MSDIAPRKPDMLDERYESLYNELLGKSIAMHENNKKRIRHGQWMMLILPVALCVIRWLTESDKVVFLIIYVVCMFALCAYLISIEYIDDSIQKSLADVTDREAEFDDLFLRPEDIQGKLQEIRAEKRAERIDRRVERSDRRSEMLDKLAERIDRRAEKTDSSTERAELKSDNDKEGRAVRRAILERRRTAKSIESAGREPVILERRYTVWQPGNAQEVAPEGSPATKSAANTSVTAKSAPATSPATKPASVSDAAVGAIPVGSPATKPAANTSVTAKSAPATSPATKPAANTSVEVGEKMKGKGKRIVLEIGNTEPKATKTPAEPTDNGSEVLQ